MGACASRPKDVDMMKEEEDEAPIEAPSPKQLEAEEAAEGSFFHFMVSVSEALKLKEGNMEGGEAEIEQKGESKEEEKKILESSTSIQAKKDHT